MVIKYVWFLALVISCRSASAPFIKPCTPGDNACIVSSAQAAVPFIAPGIPQLGVKSLDPMRLELVKGDQSGLELIIKDTTVTGMKGCTIEGAKHDLAKGRLSIVLKCTVKLEGVYKLNGKIFVLPVKGDGKFDINIRDIVIKTVNDMEVVKGADGKDHWHIKAWKHTYLTKGGAHFNFNNLFNGNKILAGPVAEFLDTNWADVMKEIAPPIVRAIVENVVEAVEQFYEAVPKDELFV